MRSRSSPRTLRYTFASSDDELVSLARELEMVNDYLALEGLRLADRLTVVRDIAPEATQVRVPVMLIQTLIENAIKHGVAELKQGGTLRIEAHVVNAELTIRILNPRSDQRAGTRPARYRLNNRGAPAANCSVVGSCA